MPIYDLKCLKCDQIYEIHMYVYSTTPSLPRTHCPSCGSCESERQYTGDIHVNGHLTPKFHKRTE